MEQPLPLDQFLELARSKIDRLTATQAHDAQQSGALMVDMRPLEQRQRDGEIPGALVVERNVLEWRLAPTSEWRLTEVVDRRLILICNQGYQSSLAAETLCRLGLSDIADVIDGFEAWAEAGLPIVLDSARRGGP